LTGIETFYSDEGFCLLSEMINTFELDFSKRSTTARVVNDFFDNSPQISFAFRIVKLAKLGGSFSVKSMTFENTTSTLSLASNNTTHLT